MKWSSILEAIATSKDLQDSKPKKQYSFPQNSGSSDKLYRVFQVKNASLEDKLKDVFSSRGSPGKW